MARTRAYSLRPPPRAPHLSLQVMKPLWPFFIAGTATLYLVAKAQESNIRCTLPRVPLLNVLKTYLTAPEFRNDPRNPYAAQLAKESIH
jgi:F-type H+-transporting ATPase subunit j